MIEADRVHSTPPLNTSVHNPADGLSRRHMMAGLAALPAAVPAVAAAASAVGTDAELIALGKKLETLVDAYYVARQPWALALSERNSALEERFGAPADRGYRDPPEYEAAAKEIDDRLGPTSFTPFSKRSNRLPWRSRRCRARRLKGFEPRPW
jgi:hypothetical protein